MMASEIKVLLVDDEDQFRTTTAKILNRRGLATLSAGSGQEALAMLLENPDVVVLDIKMPGMTGLEALGEIKKTSPEVPVILLTGHGSEDSAKEALEKGAFDFLNKPCEIDLLISRIKEAYHLGHPAEMGDENKVRDVMIPRDDYTVVTTETTVKEAIAKLRESFRAKTTSTSIMETGHRSMLITDQAGKVAGIITIVGLLKAIMPAYLSAPKPTMADAIQYSPLFWDGMFTREVKAMGGKKIGEFMSPMPPTIEAEANLMMAAYTMLLNTSRRLLVVSGDEVVGVIREQDLFFEIERVMRG